MGCDYNIDETSIKVKGQWRYLYRAVDKQGQTIDFLLTEHRDTEACGPQKLRWTRRWQQRCSSPSTHCLRNLQRLPGFVKGWLFAWISYLDRIRSQALELVRLNRDTDAMPQA